MADVDREFTPPSVDPANDGDLAGTFRAILQKMLQSVDDCLPCVVNAVNETRTRATVQPQVMMGTTDGQKISRAQIASVPILTIGGGGFLLSFPVKAGDFGWIKASDRDTSLFFQGLKEEWPNTKRMHSFSDGVFIPDIMRQWALNAEDADRMVLQSTDGVTRIAIGVGLVRVVAETVEVVAETVDFDASEVTMSGNLTVAGHVTGAGIVLDTHTHPPDNTPPNP